MSTDTGFDALYEAIERMVEAHIVACPDTKERGTCAVVVALSAVQAAMCELALIWLDKSHKARRN